MPTYSLLGSTGNVGQSLLTTILSSSPSNEVHAHCRSALKLHSLVPSAPSDPRIRIFEGPLSSRELLKSCIRGTRACFLAVAPAGNMPGTTVVSDAVKALIGALEELKAELKPGEKLPKIVVLSSASTEHRLMPHAPKWALGVLYRAFSNVYDDLKVAESYLREKGELVEVTFVKPGALSWDEKRGHVLDEGEARSPVSYGDLAAGMLEVADGEGGRWDGRSVAVNSRGEGVRFPWDAPGKLVMGLVVHFLPGVYGWVY